MYSKKHSPNSQKNTCVGVTFNAVPGSRSVTFLKRQRCFPVHLVQFFNIFFMKHLRATTSAIIASGLGLIFFMMLVGRKDIQSIKSV